MEITQEGLRQVQVHPKIGFDFEDALRSFLRADPDVIMVGEMRDPINSQNRDWRITDRSPGVQHPAHQQRPGNRGPLD